MSAPPGDGMRISRIGSTSLRACSGKAHGEAEDFQAFIDFARFLPADGGLDDVLNVGDVDAVARDLVAVDFDLEIGEAADFLDVDVRRAAHLAEHARDGIAFCFSTSRSSPKILMPMADFTPLTSSSTRSAIGCEKLDATPGSSPARRASCRPTPLSIFVVVHSSRGLSVTITSLSSTPIGSEAMSARPVLETTSMTSGNCLRIFSARVCRSSDCGSEMLGMRKVCTAIEPSSSEGRNSVPMSGTSANEPPSASTAGITTRHG